MNDDPKGAAIHEGRGVRLRVRQLLPNLFCAQGLSNAVWMNVDRTTILVDSCASHSELGDSIRQTGSQAVGQIIYSHSHRDHLFTQDAMAQLNQHDEIGLLAHWRVPLNIDHEKRLSQHWERVRSIQFKEKPLAPRYRSPLVYPSEVYHHETTIELGKYTVHVTHVKGETDDASIVHIPEVECVVAGDLLIGSWPNLGNPFKPPRYGQDWIRSLKHIRALKPKVVIPGHGPVLQDVDATHCLDDTIAGLEFVEEHVVSGLNRGHSLKQIVEEIRLPRQLATSPYLRQTYSRIELAVIAFYRSYTGWWNGDPASVYPADPTRVASEVRCAVKDESRLLVRIQELWDSGNRSTAMELIQLLIRGREGTVEARKSENLREQFLQQLLAEDVCLMTRSAWINAQRDPQIET
ncbi:MAG: MBL fold metallo-hydrolase [Firmicutes bacterium]|nr:MBL fold metallo-hydrolase [Bacillota bacterium]